MDPGSQPNNLPKDDEFLPPSYADAVQNDSAIPAQQPPSSHVDSPRNDTAVEVSNNSNREIAVMPIPQVPTVTPILQQPGQSMPLPQPISQQPTPEQIGLSYGHQSPTSYSLPWMPKPSPEIVPNDCPPGLEWLSQLNQVITTPKADSLESKFLLSVNNNF